MSCEAPTPGVDEVLCKVYIRVTPDRSEDEIRFVLLQLSPPPGSRRNDPYDRLRMKIRDLSPELIEDTFNIVWPDGEGEHVTLRSSEELSIAVSGTSAPEQSGKRVLKLLVLAGGKSGRSNLYDPEEGERHPGVVCDYCCEPIFGYRYRCLNCSDYDLCRRCEATGKIHSGHQMLRTPFPVKSLTGPDTRFQIIECLPVHRPSSMDTPTEERLSAERGDGRRSGARGPISMEAIRMSQEQVARALRSFWGALGVVGAEDCAVPPEEGEEAHAAEQHGEAVEAHELSEGASGGMLSPGAAKPVGSMASDSWVERSHRTMQQISEVLLDHYHKLGVPSVPEEGMSDEMPVEAEEAVAAENAGGQGDNPCVEQSREAVPSPEPSSPADEPSSASSAVNAESTPEGSDVEQHEPDAELTGWTDLGRDSSNPLEAAMAALKSGKVGAAMEKTAALKDPVVEGMDVKVLAGLEFMKEMGFTDEGGWLTAILQHHSGDVTKVIQLLEEMGLMKFED